MFYIQGHIVDGLKARFREFRRTKSSKSSLSQDVKVEYSFKPQKCHKDGPQRKKIKLSEKPAGEDEVSFARHNQRLRAESVKECPNRGVVQELMKVTHFFRREDIDNNQRKVVDLLRDYPFLKNEEEVSL